MDIEEGTHSMSSSMSTLTLTSIIITRTVFLGSEDPSDRMIDCFTRVLKGHIALARARFPVGTLGSHLDPFARGALWDAGLDYK